MSEVKGFPFDYQICEQENCAYCRRYGIDRCYLHCDFVPCLRHNEEIAHDKCAMCCGNGKITKARALDVENAAQRRLRER